MFRCSISLILFISLLHAAFGQDFHYTQLYATPHTQNIALTGNFDFDHLSQKIRLITNHRQQWKSIKSNFVNYNTPFSSYSGTVDTKVYLPRLLRSDYFGLGLTLFNDKAGDLNLANTQLALMFSYNKVLNRKGNNLLTFGYSQGLGQRSINYSNAYYDNQWNGTSFDPNSATNEPLQNNTFFYSDASAGILYTHLNSSFISYRVGFASFHLNNPNISFNRGNEYLKSRYCLHAEMMIPLKKNELFPSISYNIQGKTKELNINLMYKLLNNNRTYISNYFGLGTRTVGSYQYRILNDALTLHYKINYNNTSLSVSYDINSSTLNKATNLKGAMEFALLHYLGTLKQPKKLPRNYKRGKTDCPKDQKLNFELY